MARGYILELNPEEVVIWPDRVLDAVSLMQRVQQTRSAEDDDDNSEIVSHIDKEGALWPYGAYEEQPRTIILRRRGR